MSAPPLVEELCNQARQALAAGDYDQARSLYAEALATRPDVPDVHQGLASVHFLLGHLEQALYHFSEVTRLDPLRSTAWINLGAIHNRMGRYADAVAALRRGLQLDPHRSEGYYNLGIAYKRQGQRELAVQGYREAIRLSPRLADAHYNLANLYMELERYEQAAAHYEQAIANRPDFERAERGLRRARAAISTPAARQDLAPAEPPGSPSPTAIAPQPAADISPPVASDAERAAARGQLDTLAKGAEELVGELAQLIHTQLPPLLGELSRSLMQPDRANVSLGTAGAQLEQALSEVRAIRDRLKTTFDQVRAADGRVTGAG